jgi:predicted XRE-type DNA-binding protein
MDKETQKRLEAAGFRLGDAEDFLGLTDDERRLVELRLAVSRTVRRLREQQGMTQQQLAAKLKSSQSRVAKVEAAAADVSLDLSVRALFAAGGSLSDLVSSAQSRRRGGKKAHRASRPRKVKIDLIGTEL